MKGLKCFVFCLMGLSLLFACDTPSGSKSKEDNKTLLTAAAGSNSSNTSGQQTGSDQQNSDQQTITDQQKAAYGVSVIKDGMGKIDLKSLNTSIIKNTAAIDILELNAMSFAELPLGEIYNKDGLKIDASLVPDLGLKGIGIGLELTFTMDSYKLQVEGSTDTTTVSGQVDLVIGYRWDMFITHKLIISANTPDGKQLVYTGGLMDGTRIGFDDLEMSFDLAGSALGSPVAVIGTVSINDFPLYVNSEIIELLMTFIAV